MLQLRSSLCAAISLALMSLATPPASAEDGRFYLSTDRVFAPGRQPEVKLEANGVGALQIRVYRIAEPRAYFDTQSDLHRPTEDNEEPRKTTWPLLRRGARRGLTDLLGELRKNFKAEGRAALRKTFPEIHAAAVEG